MKRIISIVMIAILMLTLFGCNTKKLTVEESKANFSDYYSEIEKVAEKHNVSLARVYDSTIEDKDSYLDLNILIDDNEKIYMRLINSAIDSEKGVETFTLEYTIENGDDINAFDTDLFVELTNIVSGKSISEEQCIDFLLASEQQYAAEDYGLSKSEDMISYKCYPLNFESDWTMYYKLYQNNTEVLEFGGLTKQSTK